MNEAQRLLAILIRDLIDLGRNSNLPNAAELTSDLCFTIQRLLELKGAKPSELGDLSKVFDYFDRKVASALTPSEAEEAELEEIYQRFVSILARSN